MQEASSAGPGEGFSWPELLGGARVARVGTSGVWDNPALDDGSQGQTLTGLQDAGAPSLVHHAASSLCHHE